MNQTEINTAEGAEGVPLDGQSVNVLRTKITFGEGQQCVAQPSQSAAMSSGRRTRSPARYTWSSLLTHPSQGSTVDANYQATVLLRFSRALLCLNMDELCTSVQPSAPWPTAVLLLLCAAVSRECHRCAHVKS